MAAFFFMIQIELRRSEEFFVSKSTHAQSEGNKKPLWDTMLCNEDTQE